MKEHHIWCNYYTRPRKDCKMCERLFKLYQENSEAMMIKYFPEAIEVKTKKFTKL